MAKNRKKKIKIKKRRNNRSEEDSRKVGDLGWEEKSGQKINFSKILQVNLYLRKESKWKNTNKEVMGSLSGV